MENNARKLEYFVKSNQIDKDMVLNSKRDKILQYSEEMLDDIYNLFSELKNIQNALINSSADIEKVFRMPLLHLKINVILKIN